MLRLLTRRLHPVIVPVSITTTTVKGRKYKRAHAKIPLDIAEELTGGKKRAYAVILIGKATHLHAQYWDTKDDIIWSRLDPLIREELEVLGSTEWSPDEVILIPARPEELKRLGLDPGKPVTLDDLVDAIRRKVVAEARSPSP